MRRVVAIVAAVVACSAGLRGGVLSPGADLAEHGHWKRLKALVEILGRETPVDLTFPQIQKV